MESACSPHVCVCVLWVLQFHPQNNSLTKSKCREKNFTEHHKAYVTNKVSSSSSSLSIRKRDTQDRAQQHWQDIKSHI